MLNLKKLLIYTFILLTLNQCAWQQDPTPSTLDNSVYNQDSLNMLLHSVSQTLGSKLLYSGVSDGNYIVVYALTLQNKPTALSIISTPTNNSYFMQLIKSQSVIDHIFASTNNSIVHSDTTIVKVPYSEISAPSATAYLNSLGFTEKSNFLKRTTYFYKDSQTLTLIDYIFPNIKTNSFEN